MGNKNQIIDVKRTEPIYEHDVITFKKFDAVRGSKKGEIGAVVDLYFSHKNEYEILTEAGDVCTFNRSEFRLATPDDIRRYKSGIEKNRKRFLLFHRMFMAENRKHMV